MSTASAYLIEALNGTKETITQTLAAGGTAGASIAAARNGQLLHEAYYGYRDISTQAPPDKNTIYGIASITKSFTAAAISILVDERKLEWDTPIRTILPDLSSSDPEVTQKLTVVDLLSHQTGLTNCNEWWYGSGGEILVKPQDELVYLNALRQAKRFRKGFLYSNWGYGVVGQVIEKLSGMSYSDFVEQRLLFPLGMRDTTASGARIEGSRDLATPYATLDDRSSYELPQPAVRDGTILAAAQGLRSTAPDLIKWSTALLQAAKYEHAHDSQACPDLPLRNASKQLSKHVEKKSGPWEKSYVLEFYRKELPTQFAGLGCNSMFVEEMPTLASREGNSIVLTHGGSMAGYHTFLTLIPDLDIVFVVLTNSIALADPAGWINQYLIETIFDSPVKNDYVQLAKEAAQTHIDSYPQIFKELEEQRVPDLPPKSPSAYIGIYKDASRPFYIHILEGTSSPLQILVQGLTSQAWDLNHYQGDTFLFLTSRDDQARRALFTFAGHDDFKIIFETDAEDEVISLLWPADPNLPNYVQRFERVSDHTVLENGMNGHGEPSKGYVRSLNR